MSSTSAPFGLRVAYNSAGGTARYDTFDDSILSGYTSAIYIGAPVKWATTGVLQVASTAEDIAGVFAGCYYKKTGDILVSEGFFPASTSYDAGTMQVRLFVDQNLVYDIQANGSLAATSVQDQADFINPSSGNTTNQSSTAMISTTLVGVGVQGQLRILGLADGFNQDNAWGDSFTVVRAGIARLQDVANKVAV